MKAILQIFQKRNSIGLLFFFYLIFVSTNSFAQYSLPKKIKFELGGKVWMQWNNNLFSKVSMPSYIKEFRKQTTYSVPTNFDSITDNPLRHGATYIAIKSSATFKNKVKLNLDLYAEHRGVSYGIFNRKSLLLYPVFSVEGMDTFKLFNNNFQFYGKAGMLLDEKMDEGLTIYNIDAQGFKLGISKNKWSFLYTIYGDFYGGIGLNIDDIDAFSFKRKIGKSDSAELGVSINYNKRVTEGYVDNVLFNFFGHKYFKHSKVYFQIGYRPMSNNYSFFRINNGIDKKIATVVGYEKTYSHRNFSITNILEARYYGAMFNEANFDIGIRYREPAQNEYELYGNTVGKYLYPLRKYETPFSQWAAYTEYEGNSIFALNLRGKINEELSKKIGVNVAYDLNYINAKNNFLYPSINQPVTSSFFYPFFTASINYKIIENVETSLILTNQSMNLDLSYPTQYLLSRPKFGIRLVANF
jgi:hypothetical protein